MITQESSRYLGLSQAFARRAINASLVAGFVVVSAVQSWAVQGSAGTQTRAGGAAPSGGGQPLAAPEINPALIWGAVVLVVGGLLILSGRRRRAARSSKT